jgi:hypothetical protein
MLHAVRGSVAERLGQLPAVFTFDRAQQSAQVGAQAPPSLGAGKMAVDSRGDRFQSLAPTTGFGAFLAGKRDPRKLLFLHYYSPHRPPKRHHLQL